MKTVLEEKMLTRVCQYGKALSLSQQVVCQKQGFQPCETLEIGGETWLR